MKTKLRTQFLAIFVVLLVLPIAYSLSSSEFRSSRSENVYAVDFVESFLPVVLGENDNVPFATATSSIPSTSTPTATNTPLPTDTPSPTDTPTPTDTPSPTDTPTPTDTPSPMATSTPTEEPGSTFTPTPTDVGTATNTPMPTITPTPTEESGPPSIVTFTADDSTISAGGSTYLKWTISGPVSSLELDPIGPLPLDTVKYQVSPSETTTYTLIAGNNFGSDMVELKTEVVENQELLAFDWKKPVLKSNHGFPLTAPMANGDWTAPVNFAEGKLYIRAIINSQPIPQSMRLQFCLWQLDDYSIENCTLEKVVEGTSGNEVRWQAPLSNLYRKNGVPIDFSEPRIRYGFAIKNSAGLPVSDYLDYNWGGENPDEWFPLDIRFTVVVVAKDAEFSGWGNYEAPEQ